MSNSLYPIFVKLETLSLLIIGGGKVALEKLDSVLNNAPKHLLNWWPKKLFRR